MCELFICCNWRSSLKRSCWRLTAKVTTRKPSCSFWMSLLFFAGTSTPSTPCLSATWTTTGKIEQTNIKSQVFSFFHLSCTTQICPFHALFQVQVAEGARRRLYWALQDGGRNLHPVVQIPRKSQISRVFLRAGLGNGFVNSFLSVAAEFQAWGAKLCGAEWDQQFGLPDWRGQVKDVQGKYFGFWIIVWSPFYLEWVRTVPGYRCYLPL